MTIAQAKCSLTSETLLPELLRTVPQAREVFDRYGLRGCGGKLGPVETVGFFARTHGVAEEQLLRELQQSLKQSAAPGDLSKPGVADTIYGRFFTGAIVLVLTVGASWGAWILWRIGVAGKFTGISILEVNAHGAAQIFGWMGLFIMGFAYQAFPRLWHTELAWPRMAVAGFVAMVGGIILSTVAMPLAGSWSGAVPAALVGGCLEILAAGMLATQILVTFARSNAKWEPYIGLVTGGLFWFVAMSLMSAWHTYTTMTAVGREQLLWYVATYQAPLRDMQIHGLGLFMILGVSMRMLPALFGVAQVPNRRAWWAMGILGASVVGEVVLFIGYRWSGNHILAAFLMLPWIGLAAGCAMIALPWKLWRALPESDRSGKFVRMAYGWLAISLVMLLMLPVYQVASGIPFSHAYYGAIRHAITVGFVSLMIMGFAAKVVPTLNGFDTRTLGGLWGPFWLINIGCLLRVFMQVMTDWHPLFFGLVGISGTLEVIALTWWGVHLIRLMRAGKHRETEESAPAANLPQRISGEHHVKDVYEWFPSTHAVFEEHGFGILKQPLMRKTVARTVTIEQAAKMHGLEVEKFLQSLNRSIS